VILACPFDIPTKTKLNKLMQQQNFNKDYLTILLSQYNPGIKSEMSWTLEDLFVWASYESTELNLT
jgi:hypothetical protein